MRSVEKLTTNDVFDDAKNGDSAANAILENVYDAFGYAISAVCTVADPEVVVIGGGVTGLSTAFWLAEAGLLDGKEATTYWRFFNAFTERFPTVYLNPAKPLTAAAHPNCAGGTPSMDAAAAGPVSTTPMVSSLAGPGGPAGMASI